MFIISPYNSLRFAKRDSLLPNYDNQLHTERAQAGLKVISYCQLVEKNDAITIQIRTDYDTSVTAEILDSNNSATPVVVTEKAVYADFSTWEFKYTFSVEGNFKLKVYGTDTAQDSVTFESEPIQVLAEHPNSLLIKYSNDSNTEYVDYSTGIEHIIRVAARIPDTEDETDQNIYDNQNRKEKTYSATSFQAEFITGAIPEYLVRQIRLAQSLFSFYINDKQFIGVELSAERFGRSTLKQLTLSCFEYETPGVNDDDSREDAVITEDMNTYPINLEGVSGNQQITIPANFMPDTLIFVLKTGTNASIKVGTTPSGDEVLSPKTVNTASPVYTVDREYLATAGQYESSFILYFTITGVGATVDINTIIKRYKDE